MLTQLTKTALCGVVCLALAGVDAARTSADAPKQHANPQVKEASKGGELNRVLNEAMAEYERGNWTEARALFEAAHELSPSARTLRAIGMCAFEEKSYTAAISYLTEARKDARKPLTAEQRKQVDETLTRANEFVARYQLNLSPAQTAIQVDMQAPVIVEGKLLLNPGTRQLTFSAQGYDTVHRTIEAQPRDHGVLTMQLRAPGSTPVAAPAALPKPVQHAAARQPTSAPAAGMSTQRKVAIGLMSASVAGLALGAGFGIRAMNKHDDSGCGSTCPTRPAQGLNDQARTAGNVSTAAFIVGGAALAAGLTLYFWPRESRVAQASAHLTPALGPGFAGASARATW